MRVVDADTLRAAVGEAEALEAVERAFGALARGEARLPPPLSLEIPEARGEVHVKGAHLGGAGVFALKVASGFYANPERGLPSGSGLVLVFDAETGFPLALLRDEGYLTDLRTAAAGALAARLLAPRSVGSMAMVGSGVQARFQLRALSRVRALGEVRAWSPTREHLERYCREMEAELAIPCRPQESVESAVRDADLVVTVTPSREPLVRAEWLRDGVTVVAVGSDGPEKRELEPGVLAAADRVVADHREQCLRLGEVHHAVEAGVLAAGDVEELGDIVVGRRPGRRGGESIVCDLTGVGVQDAAIAEAAWRRVGPT